MTTKLQSETSDKPSGNKARWLLALAVTVFLALAAVYAAIIPVFEGFDAQAHYGAAGYYRSDFTPPVLNEQAAKRSYELIAQPPLYYIVSALAATGWPIDEASRVAQASVNAYFDKSLSHRQSISLPDAPFVDLAPAWIARLVALLGGLGVVLCTWWLARLLSPESLTFALAASAVAGLNPQFLFAAITISNDTWASATCALALAAGVDVVVRNRRPRTWLWVGVAFAVGTITKYSGLLVALPLAILFLFYLGQRGWREAAGALGFAVLGFVAVAGWWFVRTWLLYRELVPFNRIAEVLPTGHRAIPYSIPKTLEHIPWLVASFWGVFVSIVAPPMYLDATRWFMILGFVGLAIAAVLLLRRQDRRQVILMAVLLPWLLAVALGVLYRTRTINYGEQGRLGHIGASAFGIAMATGWQAYAPVRWRPVVHWAVAAFMVAISLAIIPFLQQSFGLPPPVVEPPVLERPVEVQFGAGMRLLGADLPAGAALEPGKALPVTLYFMTDEVIEGDYTLFLHVADDQDRLLYQFDGVPVDGRHPTRQWLPGQIFADTHLIQVDKITDDTLATLSIGFYPIDDPRQRQPITNAQGQPIGDRLVLARLRLHAQPVTPPDRPAQPLASWANGIALARADVDRERG